MFPRRSDFVEYKYIKRWKIGGEGKLGNLEVGGTAPFGVSLAWSVLALYGNWVGLCWTYHHYSNLNHPEKHGIRSKKH